MSRKSVWKWKMEVWKSEWQRKMNVCVQHLLPAFTSEWISVELPSWEGQTYSFSYTSAFINNYRSTMVQSSSSIITKHMFTSIQFDLGSKLGHSIFHSLKRSTNPKKAFALCTILFFYFYFWKACKLTIRTVEQSPTRKTQSIECLIGMEIFMIAK